jgi:hypothetical protein
MRASFLVACWQVVAATILFGLGSCSHDSPTNPQPQRDGTLPEEFGSNYELVVPCRPAVGPAAAGDYRSAANSLPAGAVLVAVLHAPPGCASPSEYVVMRKGSPGSAPQFHDWVWQQFSDEGKLLASGQLTECATCHQASGKGDFVFGPGQASVPDAPSGLRAHRLSDTNIALSWRDNANNEAGFRIRRGWNVGEKESPVIAEVPANQVAYTDPNVEQGTSYTYWVRAFNALGESPVYTGAAGSTLPEFISTFAGNGQLGLGEEGVGQFEATFYYPMDLTFRHDDDVPYIADWNNHRVRALDSKGMRTVIGTGMLGDASPGPASSVNLNHPTHVTFDGSGGLILSAWHTSKVMRLDLSTDMLENLCGDGVRRYTGDGMPALVASLNLPSSTAFDAQGRLYISDTGNQLIRRIELDGTLSRVVGYVAPGGMTGEAGFSGDGGPATQARIYSRGGAPTDPQSRVTIGPDGRLYFCDSGNNRVRVVDLTTGIIDTYAGNGGLGAFDGDGGPATQAHMFSPCDLAFGADGDLYIADTYNNCIRKVDRHGIITTVVGQGAQRGFEGDGGPPTQAKLYRPYGIAFDAIGDLYIADSFNHRIRVVRH